MLVRQRTQELVDLDCDRLNCVSACLESKENVDAKAIGLSKAARVKRQLTVTSSSWRTPRHTSPLHCKAATCVRQQLAAAQSVCPAPTSPLREPSPLHAPMMTQSTSSTFSYSGFSCV